MATQTSQRIGIWVIAVVMLVGTLAGFAAMVLIPQNEQTDAQALQKQQEQMMQEYKKSLRPLDGYKAEAFDANDVTALRSDVLKEGDGQVLTADSTVKVNYFGWTADGQIFDSSNKSGTLSPIEFSLNGVIAGWKEGLAGQKVGSTVKLTIPADKAYGNVDNGSGQPTGPLVFVVEILEAK